MDYKKEKRYHISYCGAYCHLCDWFTGRHRKIFQAAYDSLMIFGFKRLLKDKVDVNNLKLGLRILANSGICSGCKAEAGKTKDRCMIRQCADGKGLDLCSECQDFPCPILKNNPGVIKFGCIKNLKEIKTNGLKRWIDKQWREYIRNEKR
jgi:hypothetical protein